MDCNPYSMVYIFTYQNFYLFKSVKYCKVDGNGKYTWRNGESSSKKLMGTLLKQHIQMGGNRHVVGTSYSPWYLELIYTYGDLPKSSRMNC